jgi:class 3 adenylate cyclase
MDAERRPPGGGTLLTYQVWVRPKNLIGLLGIPVQVGFLSRRAFDNAFHKYDRVASLPRPSPFSLVTTVTFPPGGRERLSTLRGQLIENGAPPDLVARLVNIIETADDILLARLRPYELADLWGAPRRSVLELCLWATRLGLLEFQWDILCPLCRNARESTPTLSRLNSAVHCDSCNIDVTANFDRSVELTFRPNPAVRRTEVGEFCAGSPHLTPHIVAQQLLRAGEARSLTLPLEEGRYRMRLLNASGGQYLRAAPGGGADVTLRAGPGAWSGDEPLVGLTPTVNLLNETGAPQLMMLERMTWTDKAVTAAEVTAMQLFRDLFSNEALRPGEQISVGSVTVLFTDLRESTRLYRDVGDAVAFGRVMSHFDILRDAIDAEQGALVKTIGDAVMAVFVHPLNAIRAILKAQHELAHPIGDLLPLQVKAGIHYGPCIAVTLNNRLDYFGTTVNIAARLEGQSPTGGIVVSTTVRNDPEVLAYFDSVQDMVCVEPFQGKLKGFGDELFELWRVSLNSEGRVESDRPDET